MKLCIAILCSILGVAACKSNKSEPSNTTEPQGKGTPSRTVEPAGSAAPPAGSGAAPTDPHAGHPGSGSAAVAPSGTGPDCATEFDHAKQADKHMACVECEKHRGMGAMEADCKNAIAKPWK